MGVATCMALSIRPVVSAVLSFGTSGILSAVKVGLGDVVTAMDLQSFYDTLSQAPTANGDPSQLVYDSAAIDAFVAPFVLAQLRAENSKGMLNQAVKARQNAYLSKYQWSANIAPIINLAYNWFDGPNTDLTKVGNLMRLQYYAQERGNEIASAYISDNRKGIVKSTISVQNSVTTSTASGNQTGETLEDPVPAGGFDTLPSAPQGGGWGFPGFAGTNMNATQQEEQSNSTAQSSETQFITNTDYSYRYPYYDNLAQQLRAQISLTDELTTAIIASQGAANVEQMWANELASIDSRVNQLQINYLNTFLLSPNAINTMVTGVYKQEGEMVRAGEPVIRIEGSDPIYILASLKYDGILTLRHTVGIESNFPDHPGVLNCAIQSIRGGKDERQYDVILLTNNGHHLPTGYKFILSATTVKIYPPVSTAKRNAPKSGG